MPENDVPDKASNDDMFSMDDFRQLFGLEGAMSDAWFQPMASGGPSVSSASTSLGMEGRPDVLWLGDAIGTLSGNSALSQEPSIEMATRGMKGYFKNIKLPSGPNDWMLVMSGIRSPKSKYHSVYNDFIRASEDLLYDSHTSTKLLSELKANEPNQLYFNIIRGYTRAEEGDFDSAHVLFQDIYDNWVGIDSNRQTKVLVHCLIAFLYNGKTSEALDCLKRMWSIIKVSDGIKRFNLGLWEDWTMALMLVWHFSDHVASFANEFLVKFNMQVTVGIWQRRHMMLLSSFNPINIVPRIYYERARSLYPGLPELKESE